MNENPQPSLEQLPQASSRRYGRTAVVVHLIALLAGGLFFLAAYLQNDLSAREVFSAFGFAVGFVGLCWSVMLAVRAGLRKESVLLPIVIPLLVGWELTIPFLLLWHDPQRGFDTSWYFLHHICAPLLIPLATISATIAVPLFLLLRKVFSKGSTDRARAKKRAAIAAIASGSLLFLGLLPFGFVLYGGSMSYREYSSVRPRIWTVAAVDSVPVFIREAAFKFATKLPEKVRGRIAHALANYGYLSVEMYRNELSQSGPDRLSIRDDLRSGYERYFADDALMMARKRLNETYADTAFDSAIVFQFARRASAEEIHELFRKRQGQHTNSQTIGDLALRNIHYRGDLAEFAKDVHAMRETSPQMLRWRINMLVRIGHEGYLRDAYIDTLRSKLDPAQIVAITGMLRDRRLWPVILSGLDHSAKDVRKAARVSTVTSFWKSTNATDGKFWLQGNPITLQKLLNDPDRNDAAAIAILIHAMVGENTQTLKAQYANLPNSRLAELDWIKIQTASAQEKHELIEMARVILHNTNNR